MTHNEDMDREKQAGDADQLSQPENGIESGIRETGMESQVPGAGSLEFSGFFDACMERRRDWMRETYDRVLPAGELIFNRFEKAKYLGFGEGSSIYDTSVVMGSVTVGKNVWIGPYTILEGANAPLTIGDFVAISAGTCIYTHDSSRYFVSGGRAKEKTGPVTIGSCTQIGTMCTVLCGVTIGDHCVIGAHSLVSRDIPDYSIAAGIPAKVIGRVVLNGNEVEFLYDEGQRTEPGDKG